jgi:predicted RecB family endonuclease
MGHRRFGKPDGNQSEIVAALRAVGAEVVITTDVIAGYPDLTVGFGGETYLMEVKNGTRRLRTTQQAFWKRWKGRPIALVTSVEEALEVLGLRKGGMMDTGNQNVRDLAELDEWCAIEIAKLRKANEFDPEIAALKWVRETIRTFLLRYA